MNEEACPELSCGRLPAPQRWSRLRKVVAGDNATESRIAAVKLELRSQNRLGRGSPAVAHIDQLAATRLSASPILYCAEQRWH